MVGNDVGRIAGHEQALEVRIEGQQVFGQIPAVHLGHDHVGHQKIDFACVLPGQANGFARGACRPYGIALAFEHRCGHFQDGRLVFHQQNGFVAPRGGRRRSFRTRLPGLALVTGQIDRERCPLPRLAVHVDKTVVLLDDAIHSSQPQAGAFARVLGGEKRFEQFVQCFLVHTTAVIADGEPQIFPGRKARVIFAVALIEGAVFRLDYDLAHIGDGVPCVDTQVGQNLVNLGRVQFHRPQIRLRMPLKFDVLADQTLEHFEHAFNGFIQVEHPGRDCLLAGEGQQLLCEGG